MNQILNIFKREIVSYFATPIGYVFIMIFLLLSGWMTFYQNNWYEQEIASLLVFFSMHLYLYLFLVPAISMRLWAEERKSGTIELLLTLPVTMFQAVLGKFFAAWAFCGIALALTFPIWITVNYLGNPDNGVILASYLGSFLLAGAFLSIGACLSALTRNQVIAFILTVVVCFGFLMIGRNEVLEFLRAVLPQVLVDGIASLSFLSHYGSITRGVLELRDILFFVLTISFWLIANAIVIDLKKAE